MIYLLIIAATAFLSIQAYRVFIFVYALWRIK